MRALFGLVAAGVLAGCSGPLPAEPDAAGNRVVLMTFNVENLFDTRHDPGREDHTFLPLALKLSPAHRRRCEDMPVARWRAQCLEWDWSEAVLAEKIERIARVVLAAGEGRGPDLLALQEVENRAVLERLERRLEQQAGPLEAVLIEGDDSRGIDVAFISRLSTVGQPRLHLTSERNGVRGDPRGILEQTFRLPDGSLLTGFNVHFAAPYRPLAQRLRGYERLNELAGRLPPGRLRFAAGDFNTPADELREHRILERYVDPHWAPVHVHCRRCQGTYFYAPERQWSFLDMILLGHSLGPRSAGPGWHLSPASVALVRALGEQSTGRGTPAGFELPGPSGVSDHWPLVAALRYVAVVDQNSP